MLRVISTGCRAVAGISVMLRALPVLAQGVHREIGTREDPQVAHFTNSSKAAALEGPLRLDRANPFHFLSGHRYLFLMGVSDRSALCLWHNDKGFDWRRYLTALADNGFNYVREDVTAWSGLSSMAKYPAQFSRPSWAFARTGTNPAVDGRPQFDLTRFDEGYFRERLIPFLEEAQRLGIVVELTLFDACRKSRAFEDSLYSEQNNVNALGLVAGNDPNSDAVLNRPHLLAIQEDYVAHVVAATSRFGNVIFEVANESGGARWVAHFVDFIHERRPDALVSADEQGSAYDPVAGRCDVVVKHRGTGGLYSSNEDILHHRQSLIQFRRGRKPVLHNEFFLFANRSTDNPAFVRRMFWADFTGGGHANFYDFTWWRGTGRTADEGTPSRIPPEEIMQGGKYLRRFIEQSSLPFWRMRPHDELASSEKPLGIGPFVYAIPNVDYVLYFLTGEFALLDLRHAKGSFSGCWYNPRRGEFGNKFKLDGGQWIELTTPDTNDWALRIWKE